MNNLRNIISSLQNKGYRITPIRKSILAFFILQKALCSAPDLLLFLKHNKKLTSSQRKTINKTTVYRELAFLTARSVIHEIQLGDRKKHFELIRDHHHHLVCTHCDAIQDITLKKVHVKEMKRVAKQKNFHVTGHSFELFGVCHNCK